MTPTIFTKYAAALERMGKSGATAPEFCLGTEGPYELRYIPFEHINREARLVIVGITPGPKQIGLAYEGAQALLRTGASEERILAEVIKTGGFGGKTMRPNLLKMLRHFEFDKLLGIEDVATLWSSNAHLLHSTSMVKHAAFKRGKPFNGSFEEVLASPLLRRCFMDCFVASLGALRSDALYVALGPYPKAALDWCVVEGHLSAAQVIGAFCHPSSNGGSNAPYYLRERSLAQLSESDPVRHRAAWLDAAYKQMWTNTRAWLGEAEHVVPGRTLPARAPEPVHAEAAAPSAPKEEPAAAGREPSDLPDEADAFESPDIRTIVDEIVLAGCTITKDNKKVVEFETSLGQVAYLIKKTSRLNRIVLLVDPANRHEDLVTRDGVASVTGEHRFHANMRRFPARRNKGKKDEHYGWQVFAESLGDMQRFLAGL